MNEPVGTSIPTALYLIGKSGRRYNIFLEDPTDRSRVLICP